MSADSRFYSPIESFIEQDSDPLRKRILQLVYAAIYEDKSADVTRSLLRAYDQQCEEDERPEAETLEHNAAWSYMHGVYIKERARRGRDADAAAEEFEWPNALPTDYPLRKGIVKSVALRMAAADDWSHRQMMKAFQAERESVAG